MYITLRNDEIFVAECLVQHLGNSNKVTWREGENPPDIYLESDGESIAVEITQLSPISFDNQGIVKNRRTEDNFAYRLCDELELKFRDRVPSDKVLHLFLYVPVADVNRYSQELISMVDTMLQDCSQPKKKTPVKVAGEKVEVLFNTQLHYNKKIVGHIINKDSNLNILFNAQAILYERIAIKQQKCKDLAFYGPKWLALLNMFYIADVETYAQAISECPVKHNFEKIFVISDNRTVNEIHGKI